MRPPPSTRLWSSGAHAHAHGLGCSLQHAADVLPSTDYRALATNLRLIDRRTFGAALACTLFAACGEAAQAPDGVPPEPSDAERRAYKATVAAILTDERAAFDAFFGPEADAWANLDDISGAEPLAVAFLDAMTEAQASAAELEAPARATLFHGSFLEHFDRFVADAAGILGAIRAGQAEDALATYHRLRRGAFARLDFLADRLALIDA